METNLSFWGIRCAWMRYFDVFRKNWLYGVVTTFVDPLLYLISFGFGLGSLVGTLNTAHGPVSYRAFIFGGVVAQTLLFQGFFEASYGGFVRMYYQRIFKAMAITPITLAEVLWAELLWVASKGTFAATAVLVIGCLTGDFNPVGALLALPLCFLSALLFGAIGLTVSANSKTIESISYPQYLFIFPMFLFCGVYFPVETLPGPLPQLAWFFPLTSIASLLRTLTLGFPFQWQSVPIFCTWLGILIPVSRHLMTRRLIK
jgi:lipooligosaccharide transport system permease protein